MTAGVKKATKVRWGVVYVLFVLLVLEIGLRVIFVVPRFNRRLSVNDDYSWRRTWVSRHRNGKTDLYYSFDQYSPTLGWTSQPNLHDVHVFANKILNTNRLGLRGVTDFSYEKTPGKIRILLLGDSFTFGEEVGDDETYAHYLQTMLPQAEVINMGVHGYGHDQMLLLFLEEGIKYKPDIVILGFISEDMARNVLAFRDFAKPRLAIRDGKLVLTNVPVPRPETVLRDDWMRPRILDALSILFVGAQMRSGQRQIQEREVTRLILDRWTQAVTSLTAIPVIAYLPFEDELTSRDPLIPGERFLFTYCDTNRDVYCFSARPHFLANIQSGLAVASRVHWDSSGHRTIAEAIVDFLVNKHHWIGAGPAPAGRASARTSGLPDDQRAGEHAGTDAQNPDADLSQLRVAPRRPLTALTRCDRHPSSDLR